MIMGHVRAWVLRRPHLPKAEPHGFCRHFLRFERQEPCSLVPLSRSLCKPQLGQPIAAQENTRSPVYVAMRRRINNVDGLAADGECQPLRDAKGLITVSTRIPRRMNSRTVFVTSW